jgi:hypothetical protein
MRPLPAAIRPVLREPGTAMPPATHLAPECPADHFPLPTEAPPAKPRNPRATAAAPTGCRPDR